ncbi:hypothetical protein [Ascidiimonas sp. W6]|uniref:hypothetical protein n=1 Tax=Ascidiimonas meishanensis TaxID=3128903 RepID=UPI0030EE70AD
MKKSNSKKGLNLNKKVISNLDEVASKLKGGAWTTSISRCTYGPICCGFGDCTTDTDDPDRFE